jgi:L-ribulose-5-phosphate 3-epimerase
VTHRRLGAATYGFLYSHSLPDALRALAEAGVHDVELTGAAPHVEDGVLAPRDAAALRRLVGELGVRLVSLNPTYLDLNLASLNRGIREESVRQLLAALRLCHDLEAERLVLFGGRRHVLLPAPMERVEPVLLDGLATLAAEAERLGVTIGLENGPTLLLERGRDVARVLETVGHPRLRAVFDVANAWMVEEPAAGIEPLLDRLCLLHLSDTTRARWAHAPVGEGTVPFAAFAERLALAGGDEPSILEVIEMGDPLGGIRRSIDRLEPLGWATSAPWR